MQELIALCQASFVPGRQGVDNVVIYQEFVHTMRYTKARKAASVVKVDLEKAFNRLEWSFIAETLEDAEMPSKIYDVIMQVISKVSCSLLWNGDATNII